MSELDQFKNSIAAAGQLVDMYVELRRRRGLGQRGRLDAANLDLLWLPRSAVVACLSALDAYIHGVVFEQLPVALQADPIPEALCDRMAEALQIKNGKQFRKAMPILLAPEPVFAMCTRLQPSIESQAYQAPWKIEGAYALIGHESIFDEVARIWPGPGTTTLKIKDRLERYFRRRNQIAHEGDMEYGGTTRHMTPKYARDCQGFTECLVVRLNRVVYGA